MGSKCSDSEHVKYSNVTFLKENYNFHNLRMHIDKWTKYCELGAGANNSFFNIVSIYGLQTTLYAYAGPLRLPLCTLINR